MTDEIILPTDDRAATYRTDITGWVDRFGLFFGKDERLARWSGATHMKCKQCDAIIPKYVYTACDSCREKARTAKLDAAPKTVWDETNPVSFWDGDRLFFDLDELEEYCEEEGINLATVRLQLWQPVALRELHADYWDDDLCDDDILPDDILDAIDALNAVIRARTEPLSYTATGKAVTLPVVVQTLANVAESISERLATARAKALMSERLEAQQLLQSATEDFDRFAETMKAEPGYQALIHAFDVTRKALQEEPQ